MADMFDGGSFDSKVREAVLRLIRDDYDHEFNKEIAGVLRNWYDVPEEFKGNLISHVESGNVQVPISQVVGNFLTETTTADLGGNIHGRIGMVRGGTTPYDFFQLTYDAVYEKWVSNFFIVMSQLQTFTHTGDTAYAENDQTQDFVLPYESFFNAGITPQFRLMGQLDNSGAATSTATVLMGTFDTNDPISAVTEPSWNIANTGTTEAFKDTGWQDIPSMTVKDFVIGAAVLKTSNSATTASVTGMTLLARWVSL